MFAPRSVASKGKGKAVDTTLEATEAPTPAADSLPAQTALEVEDEAEVEPVGRERLEKVLFELEVALSDWGLARFPALLEALRKDDQGCTSSLHCALTALEVDGHAQMLPYQRSWTCRRSKRSTQLSMRLKLSSASSLPS